MKSAHCLLWLASALLLPLSVNAQWQWIDKDNKKVFSDTAPPPEVPDAKILRRPGPPRMVTNTAPVTAAPADAVTTNRTATPAAGKPVGVDKELEEKTRKAEEAEKARKAEEAQKLAAAKAENCTRAKQGKATFDSGIRVARINAQGEREVMDDAMRSAEQTRLQGVIKSDCK